jgi:iron complex outermembrane recepter protein
MIVKYVRPLAVALALLTPLAVRSQSTPGRSTINAIQVTATRIALPVQEVPYSVNIISNEELRARGVNDLRTALALLGGVTVAPGGDEGPAGASPGLLGLREADDFLLVIDGVPAGGAFTPHFSTLNLTNVERIEVQRGTAPVFYGTTAFAGTINIIHYPAGAAERTGAVSFGSYGSVGVEASGVLSDGPVKQSLSGDITRDRLSDQRAGMDRGHLLYRLAGSIAGGKARMDADLTAQHQKPTSPTPFTAGGLSTALPVDFNQNPADAKIDTNRASLTGGYERDVALGAWSTTLAVTGSRIKSVRGFLHEDFDDDTGPNATGFQQTRDLTDVFLDSHVTAQLSDALTMIYGVNELYGRARQSSTAFDYFVPLDGDVPPSSGGLAVMESTFLRDTRSFFGLYTQTRWALGPRLALLAGLRLNHTDEKRETGDTDDVFTQTAHANRLSGSIGANWRMWQSNQGDLDHVVAYVNYGNTFQPPQVDFGPEAEGAILRPETEKSYEAGIKANGLDGRLEIDLAAFFVDFGNQPITTQSNGTPLLASGGQQRFKGIEIEGSYRPGENWLIAANYSYNDARYRDFRTLVDGEDVQLGGNRLVLSPRHLAAFGLTYGGRQGFHASITANYVGDRFLDIRNTIRAGAYLTTDASIGYQFPTSAVTLSGYNLTDRRDPVLTSELGEQQFYRLPGRRAFLKLSIPL